MPWYLLFSGNFFIIQTFSALIDRTGKGLYWNFFCQLLKPFSQSSIHEVVPFHHPKAKGTLLYKVLIGFWPVAWQKLKAQMLGSFSPSEMLSFSVLSSPCGWKLFDCDAQKFRTRRQRWWLGNQNWAVLAESWKDWPWSTEAVQAGVMDTARAYC